VHNAPLTVISGSPSRTAKLFPLNPRDHSPSAFFEQCRARSISDRTARRWLGSTLGKGESTIADWRKTGLLSQSVCDELTDLPRLTLESTRVSSVDGFRKLLFRTHDGLPLETVIIPLHIQNAASICLSSQVGCVMGCTFCATARMSARRSLATWEIVDQFLQARAVAAEHGRRVTGAVFMGMGEPFLNYDRVLAAAELLCFPVLNAISAKAITISTVGLVPEIRKFIAENRPFRLSISIGAAIDEKRAKLVPIAARTPVREMMAAAREYALRRKTRVNIAYVCIQGENVGEEDAIALRDLIGDTQVRIDLITVTDTSGRYSAPSFDELESFRDALRKYVGQPVVRRYSGGADIQAACGTLAGATL
jgi:23S rRNA (adenine2503-C2)-methyltransferase